MLILIAIPLMIFAAMKKLTWSRVVWICVTVDYLLTFLYASGQPDPLNVQEILVATLLTGSLVFAMSIGLTYVLFRAKIQRTSRV